jgi:hypothetical protein
VLGTEPPVCSPGDALGAILLAHAIASHAVPSLAEGVRTSGVRPQADLGKVRKNARGRGSVQALAAAPRALEGTGARLARVGRDVDAI